MADMPVRRSPNAASTHFHRSVIRAGEDRRKLRPGVGRAHIDDPYRRDARLRRLDPTAQGAPHSPRRMTAVYKLASVGKA